MQTQRPAADAESYGGIYATTVRPKYLTMKKQLLLIGLAWLTSFASAQPAAPANQPKIAIFPAGVKRVIFLGDSITYGGFYVSDIEAWRRTRQPQAPVEILNLGLASETTSGLSEPEHVVRYHFPRPDLHERLARVLAQTKPDLVLACYGMNDGIYLPFDEARFRAFQEGITRLHVAVEKTGGKIIHITPPVFDEVRGGHPGYAAVLDRYSAWLVAQRAVGWQVIDVHTPMQRALAAAREKNPAFAFAKDGIHPDEAGHWLLAQTILTSLGATDVASATNAAALLADWPHSGEMLRLIHEQQAVLKDAWLTAIGHKRPQRPGLPLPEARAQAAALETQIQKLLAEKTGSPVP